MAVAFVALIAAISGSAIALPGKNGVDKNDIKKNAVDSSDIKNNSVTGKDAKNGSLTGTDVKNNGLAGADIDESSLGKVPSAAAADAATRAGSAGAVDRFQTVGKKATATEGASDATARAAAPEVPLFTSGPFTIYGKCYENTTTDQVHSAIYIRTTENGSVGDTEGADLDGPPFLDTNTPEENREVISANAGNNATDFFGNDSTEFGVFAPSGAQLTGLLSSAALNGTVAGGPGAYGAADSCLFNGSIFG